MKPIHRTVAWLAAFAIALAALPPAGAAQAGKVNINTATEKQLAYLPRVGDVVAKRIVEHRDKNGRFKSPEELMLVKGIGEKTFEMLKPYISVAGDTTLAEKVRISENDPDRI